jgi:uncharacterized membrane protein SpoIIM required for sporulation
MNVERWVGARRPTWQKLEDILRQVEHRGVASLSRQQLQSLGRLYRSASADLSRARAMNLGNDITTYLNNLVVKAHNQVYQRANNRWMDLFNYLWVTFPALFRQYFVYTFVSFLLFVVPLAGTWYAIVKDPSFAHLEVQAGKPLVDEELWSTIEQKKMWTDEAQGASPAVASAIATNNIRVSLIAFAGGVTFALLTVFIIIYNGLFIGAVFGACQIHGMLPNILSFVSAHGVIELSEMWIAGGAGLIMGVAMLFPGEYGRLDALKLAARPAFGLLGGCIPLLVVAGTIEGFISPRTDIPATSKFAVAAATGVLLILYLCVPRQPLGQKPVPVVTETQPAAVEKSPT